MTTIFAAAEYAIGTTTDELIRVKFFSTRQLAWEMVGQWVIRDITRDIKWTWQKDGYWQRKTDIHALSKLVVEEHMVHDSLDGEFVFPPTPDSVTINTPLYAEPDVNKSSCLHDNCPTCNGTGQSKYGGICVHGLVCPCPKCSFR